MTTVERKNRFRCRERRKKMLDELLVELRSEVIPHLSNLRGNAVYGRLPDLIYLVEEFQEVVEAMKGMREK